MTDKQEQEIMEVCKTHNFYPTAPELEAIKACCEDYNISLALEAFDKTPVQYFSPQKKTKEIALQAAINMRPSPSYSANFGHTQPVQPHYDLLKEAEAIYQWLIKS